MIRKPTLRSLLLAGALAAAASLPARADVFEDLGLTGGGNSAAILEVKGPGALTFDKDDYEGGFEPVSNYSGPRVKAEILCKRSGYRCARLGDQELGAKEAREEAETSASLSSAKAVKETIHKACLAKKTTVQLPVTVVGKCTKVKFAIGAKNYKVSAPGKNATFTITCTGYEG